MTVVGFDVAKKSVVGAVIASDGSIIRQGCIVANTDEVLYTWLSALRQEIPDELLLCCESTGYYHYPLLRTATALGLPCRVVNAIMTKQAAKMTIRGKKTDRTDAVLIARLGLRGEGQLQSSADTSGKQLLRTAAKLRVVAQTLSSIRRSMEERRVPLPVQASENIDTILTTLNTAISACRTASGNGMDDSVVERLTSIPGVGVYTARVLVAEIGDIRRFASADRLVAFTGFDPRVRQSGTSLNRNTKLTKRGSPQLRHAVFLAATVMRRHDLEVEAYYQKKRGEGRTYTEAMMPVCRKLLTRVHAVWLREEAYVRR